MLLNLLIFRVYFHKIIALYRYNYTNKNVQLEDIMNPFKNTIALNKIRAGFRKYMKNVPAIRAAQAKDDHAKAQRFIR